MYNNNCSIKQPLELTHSDVYYKVIDEVCDEKFLLLALDYLDIKTIYCNQILSEEFIVNHLLNPDNISCVEDTYITYEHVKKVQEHIKNKPKFNKS